MSRILVVEDEQRLWVGLGRRMIAAGRQLEVGAGSGQIEEHPVIAVVVAEAPDLGQTGSVSASRVMICTSRS